MNAARKSQRPEQRSDAAARNEPADAARLPEEAEQTRPERGAGEAPPHALWDQLDDWASGRSARAPSSRKLPIAARAAIIVLLSVACWLAIIALLSLL